MPEFGLVGKTLGHSFSKHYFEEKFRKEGLNYTFENFELSSIEEIQGVFSIPDLKGFSVTIPYKEQIISYLDSLSEEAKVIGQLIVFVYRRTDKESVTIRMFSVSIK